MGRCLAQNLELFSDPGYEETCRSVEKVARREKSARLPAFLQPYSRGSSLRICADRVDTKDWPAILRALAENRSLSKVHVYSRCRSKVIRENVNTEGRLAKLRRCGAEERERPVLYTNFLLRCLVDSVAVFARDSTTIAEIVLDGVPLGLRYLRVLCAGLEASRSLRNLSLTGCRIGDTGCDFLLGSLRNNPSISVLNLSSCRLTGRSARCFCLFLKIRKTALLKNVWMESGLQSHDENGRKEPGGLQTLILNRNPKFGDNGVRELTVVLREDFWLKSLGLRRCGITKVGGDAIAVLLQTNSVLTEMDLRENDIPEHILYGFSKILRRRRKVGWSVSLKKKLFNQKTIYMQKVRGNKVCNTHASDRNKYRAKQAARCKKDGKRVRQKLRKGTSNDGIKRRRRTKKENLQKLESRLFDTTNGNFNLAEKLSNNTKLLGIECDKRTRVEEECRKIKLRLRTLKKKLRIFNRVHTEVCNETHMIENVQSIFGKLEICSVSKKFITRGDNLNEKVKTKQVQSKTLGTPLQRRPNSPPQKAY